MDDKTAEAAKSAVDEDQVVAKVVPQVPAGLPRRPSPPDRAPLRCLRQSHGRTDRVDGKELPHSWLTSLLFFDHWVRMPSQQQAHFSRPVTSEMACSADPHEFCRPEGPIELAMHLATARARFQVRGARS